MPRLSNNQRHEEKGMLAARLSSRQIAPRSTITIEMRVPKPQMLIYANDLGKIETASKWIKASFTAGLIQVVNMDDLTSESLRLLPSFKLFFDSAWI